MNDTKERMETLFGKDEIWAREMQKRQELDRQEEAVRPAPELPAAEDDDAADTTEIPPLLMRPPVLDVDVSRVHAREDTNEWFAGESAGEDTSDDDSDDSLRGKGEEPVGRKSLTLQHAIETSSRTPKTRGSLRADHTGSNAEHDSESDDSEDIPLSQLRPTSVHNALSNLSLQPAQNASAESDEELPLSKLIRRQKSGIDGIPRMQTERPAASAIHPTAAKQTAEESEDSDDDAPLGLVHPSVSFNRKQQNTDEASADADDRPLGVSHPQAAIIAEQAAMIKHLQMQVASPQPPAALSQWPIPSVYMLPTQGNHHLGPAATSTPFDQAGPVAVSPIVDIASLHPKANVIDRWRSEVPAEPPASVPSVPSS